MVRILIDALTRVVDILETSGVASRDDCRDEMTAAFRHGGLEPRELSEDLSFNVSTVFRWQQGRSAPHPDLCPRIVDWVIKVYARKIDDVERGLESAAGAEGTRPRRRPEDPPRQRPRSSATRASIRSPTASQAEGGRCRLGLHGSAPSDRADRP